VLRAMLAHISSATILSQPQRRFVGTALRSRIRPPAVWGSNLAFALLDTKVPPATAQSVIQVRSKLLAAPKHARDARKPPFSMELAGPLASAVLRIPTRSLGVCGWRTVLAISDTQGLMVGRANPVPQAFIKPWRGQLNARRARKARIRQPARHSTAPSAPPTHLPLFWRNRVWRAHQGRPRRLAAAASQSAPAA
jgi:hypothetical protein